jgi:hypothetical protein
MATEEYRRAHDALRERMQQSIREGSHRTNRVIFPLAMISKLPKAAGAPKVPVETRHPRDILRDMEMRRAPPVEAVIQPILVDTPIVKKAKAKTKGIPKKVRTLVWNEYIGKKIGESACVCCNRTTIDKAEFQCGHIIARANGGPETVENLRPICAGCNTAMGTQNMEEFCIAFFGRGIVNRLDICDDPTTESVEKNYDRMKLNELRQLCKEKGLKNYSKAKKSELIEMMRK